MEQEILKEWQKKAIDFVFSKNELSNFYLTGGTALAGYYLHHRISDDLDFFSFDDFDSMSIHGIAEELRKIIGATNVRFSKLYDRNQFFYSVDSEEYKVEFTRYPFKQLECVKEVRIRLQLQNFGYKIVISRLNSGNYSSSICRFSISKFCNFAAKETSFTHS